MVFDELTAIIGEEYLMFQMALNGRYLQLRAPGVEVSPRAVNDIKRDIAKLAESFINAATTLIASYADSEGAGRSKEVQSRIELRRALIAAQVRTIAYENVADVIKATRVGIGGIGDLLVRDAGAVGLLMQSRTDKIEFTSKDTSGRRWKSAMLLKVIVRDYAYQSFIDRQVDEMAEEGETHFAVIKQDGSVVGEYPVADLQEVRDTVFHPNSHNMVAYVSSE